MKLMIRQYLASLKERGELDALLPDLLSQMGLEVFLKPLYEVVKQFEMVFPQFYNDKKQTFIVWKECLTIANNIVFMQEIKKPVLRVPAG